MIPVTAHISLDEREIEETFVRSSGPGGQNVNKLSTAVQLRFDVRHSPSLPNDVQTQIDMAKSAEELGLPALSVWLLEEAVAGEVQSLGGKFEYDEVKRKFTELYWGVDGIGNVKREKWLLPAKSLARLSRGAGLALFTGRTRKELDYTLEACRVRKFFTKIVTVEDVQRPKPDSEGLLKILNGRDPATAIYVGDSVDDAIQSAYLQQVL